MTPKTLIVDDQKSVRESLKELLETEDLYVETVASGKEALAALRSDDFQLVLLDIKMPGENGLDVLRQITTQFPRIKVFVVTGFGSLEKAVEAFRSGACDFIEKPIIPEELFETIERVLRENTAHKRKVLLLDQLETTVEQLKDLEGITTTNRYVRREISFAHEIVFDVDRHELHQGNHRVHLTPSESKLLLFFTENPNCILNFVELVNNVQGYETYAREAAGILRPMISRLRIKLKEFPAAVNWIKNIRGKGYIFLPE